MPSRNSINKPKQTINLARKNAGVSKKRAARVRNGLVAPPRSALSSTSGLPKSTAVALYNGEVPVTSQLTTRTLSNKRLNKIQRNKRYLQQRKDLEDKILIDATAQAEESMDIDEEKVSSKRTKRQSKVDGVKKALLSVLDDAVSSSFVFKTTKEGTTLGGPSF
jgi:ribosome biogenesis protein ALB1